MTRDVDEKRAFFDSLDQTEWIVASIGLVLSGAALAAGIAGLVYVAINVLSASPPSFGSQGEWLWGAVVCLLIAGWGFSQAAKFFARLRGPEVRLKDDARAKGSAPGFTWSFTSNPMPLTTFKLDESQLAAADAALGSGAEWDAVCREINPEYAMLSAFEQGLYRHAVQLAVEDRRSNSRG